MAQKTVIGVIGGSGLLQLEEMNILSQKDISTPWGNPSSPLIVGLFDKQPVVFLSRHGEDHHIPPSQVNYRANIYALKQEGVTDLISLSACGSLREEIMPGDFVRIDQFIDMTSYRKKTFFEKGCVAHVSMATPICERLGKVAKNISCHLDVKMHETGTYIAIEGPQFSTYAESCLYKNNWGGDIIGMTNMPEAKLAREAEMCYLAMGMVTDYDSWHPQHKEKIDMDSILNILKKNVKTAQNFLHFFLQEKNLFKEKDCSQGCNSVLQNAIVTSPEKKHTYCEEKLPAFFLRS